MDDPNINPDKVDQLARSALGQLKPFGLPPSVDKDDLKQTAVTAIIEKAQQAHARGKVTHARYLIAQAKAKMMEEIKKAQRQHEVEHARQPREPDSKDTRPEAFLYSLLEVLTEHERDVIIHKYGLNQIQPHTHEQLMAKFDLSRRELENLLDQATQKMADKGNLTAA